jgi:hypothetical protein
VSEEKLPISEYLKVIEHVTLFKSERWWSAVAITESYDKKNVSLYLWTNTNGKWKRLYHYRVNRKSEWEKLKSAVDILIQKVDTAQTAKRQEQE